MSDHTELVKRLRGEVRYHPWRGEAFVLFTEGADAIEEQAATIARLTDLLEHQVRAAHEFYWIGHPDKVAVRLFGAAQEAQMDLSSAFCECGHWGTEEPDETVAAGYHAAHVNEAVAEAVGGQR